MPRHPLPAATLLALTACQVATPVLAPAPGPARITAELSSEGQRVLTPVLGPDVSRVEGRITALRGDTLVMDIERLILFRGNETRRQPFTGLLLPRAWVSALTTPRTHLGKSLLAGAATAAAAGGMAAIIGSAGSPGTSGTPAGGGAGNTR